MSRYGNVLAVTEIDCDLCNGLLQLTIVDDKPREGEITLTSKTTVCPHCNSDVPVRLSDQAMDGRHATES